MLYVYFSTALAVEAKKEKRKKKKEKKTEASILKKIA